MQNDSIAKTLFVVILLCAVCSLIVSIAAVQLRPLQQANAADEISRGILEVAGLNVQGAEMSELLKMVDTRLVDLASGKFSTALPVERFDMLRAAQDPALSRSLSSEEDITLIGRLPKYAKVYLIKDQDRLKRIILPIYGYGLWSTLYGFIALQPDGNTVYRLKFYQHKETPGLGGRIDSMDWRKQWEGKRIYNRAGQVALGVGKCRTPVPTNRRYQIDGLSGATLTACGVNNMIDFWFSDKAYGKFLQTKPFDPVSKASIGSG